MDIRGIRRVQSFLGGIVDARPKQNINASADRDAHQGQHEERRRAARLTQDQVDQAFKTLIESLKDTELHAESSLDEEGASVFIIKNTAGTVVRELKGLLITDLYLKSFEEVPSTSGTLLKRSA